MYDRGGRVTVKRPRGVAKRPERPEFQVANHPGGPEGAMKKLSGLGFSGYGDEPINQEEADLEISARILYQKWEAASAGTLRLSLRRASGENGGQACLR